MSIVEKCQDLVSIDSPSGFTMNVRSHLVEFALLNEIKYEVTPKGNVLMYPNCEIHNAERLVATHIDTLGVMVRAITKERIIKVTPIGSPIASTLNGEYAKLYTRAGNTLEGTILLDSNAKHVFADSEKKVEFNDLYFRLDAKVESREDLEALGISVGDYICYDPKFRVSNGYINSRFLDDKLCAAISLEMLEQYKQGAVTLTKPTVFAFTCFEEVGHGLSYLAPSVEEVIALDMGCVGDELDGSELKVSICAKDSSGPYDYDSVTEMVAICKDLGINHAVDVYPFYGSDASAALRGGNNIKASLIGPGIAASHGMERAHVEAVDGTYRLLEAMLQK